MSKKVLTDQQKRAEFDLNIIIIVTFIVLGIYMGFQNQFARFANNKNIHVLLRTTVMAFMQFGVAGLGISIVSVYRRESFSAFGLHKEGAVASVFLSILACIPYFIFRLSAGQINNYLPFQSVWMTKEVLSSGFPVNLTGMLLIVVAWGFFEGFNYVVISEKINARYPSSNKWLNWGAITCGVMCLLIHGMIGITPAAIIEAITVFIIIYGMLMAKEFTGSAWGCIFVFLFFWNAL